MYYDIEINNLCKELKASLIRDDDLSKIRKLVKEIIELMEASGQWYSETLSKRQLKYLINNDENFAHDWDEKYGDKLIKLVFIGQNLDKVNLKKELDLL